MSRRLKGAAPNAVHPDKLIRVRLVDGVEPVFIAGAVHTGPSRRYIRGKSKTAAGQVGISGADLKATRIPLAPAPEQVVVASLVGRSWRTVFDHHQRSLDAARASLDTLDQAILAKAFRGELVPQDPDDEPASALLERIKAERAAQPKRGR